jgi:three-Cys-motif partner protein
MKIATQRAPILIVDAFAGPGQFGDNELGSPLIICQSVKAALSRHLSVPVSVVCIEPIKDLFDKLNHLLNQFDFAEAKYGKFADYINEIEHKAKNHSIFLYVDPWTVEGLDWKCMDRVFQHLNVSRMSIEVLMNFNAPSFVRRGLAALKMSIPEFNPEIEDLEEIDAPLSTSPSIQRLNNVVGGKWWQYILKSQSSFPQKVQELATGVSKNLSKRFKEVCKHAIKAQPHHTVPKYYLIFGSRHPDALILMNDQMVKSRQMLAELAKPKDPTLFEIRSTDLVPDIESLPPIILEHASRPTERRLVILDVIRDYFCYFSVKQIRGCIESMLRKGTLKSETGKIKINNKVKIFASI